MLETLIHTHPILLSVGGYFLFSSVIGGMPEPAADSGLAYRWAYTSLHLLAGNVSTAIAARYPQYAAGKVVVQTTTS